MQQNDATSRGVHVELDSHIFFHNAETAINAVLPT